jgi:hypothetical protein
MRYETTLEKARERFRGRIFNVGIDDMARLKLYRIPDPDLSHMLGFVIQPTPETVPCDVVDGNPHTLGSGRVWIIRVEAKDQLHLVTGGQRLNDARRRQPKCIWVLSRSLAWIFEPPTGLGADSHTICNPVRIMRIGSSMLYPARFIAITPQRRSAIS